MNSGPFRVRRQSLMASASVTVNGRRETAAPGLYVRLFDHVRPGTDIEIVGKIHGKHADTREPVRLDVLDPIADIEDQVRRANLPEIPSRWRSPGLAI